MRTGRKLIIQGVLNGKKPSVMSFITLFVYESIRNLRVKLSFKWEICGICMLPWGIETLKPVY